MNVRYVSLLVAMILSMASMAQLKEEIPSYIPNAWKKSKVLQKTQDKSTPCGIDTLYYSRYNNSGLVRFLNLQPTRGAGMYFKADDTVQLYGFNFFAYALQNGLFFTSQQVTCKVYNADANRLPANPALISKTHTINATNTTLGQLRQTVLFNTPIELTSDFIVTVEFNANLANQINMASNNYDSLDGFGNFFSCVRINNNWSNNLNVGGIPFDADFFFEPVVEYNMSANFGHGENSCFGNGNPFEFINTSAFASNPQFSKGVLDNSLDDDFVWDFGDGSLTDTTFNAVHTYTGSFGHWVSLSGSFENWRGATCADDTVLWLEKGDVKASYTYTRNGQVLTFANASTDADRVEWDFGDGTPKSTQENPLHYFSASIVYSVKLKAWNKGCVDSLIMEIDMKDYTGVETLNKGVFNLAMMPNPATNVLNFISDLEDNEVGRFEIYNVQGKIIKEGLFRSNSSINIKDLPKGLHFVRFNHNSTILTKRLVIN